MRITATIIFFLAIAATAGAAADERNLTRFAWMAGCWVSELGEPGSGEHWLPLAGGTMLGVGRTVKAGRTVEHEFLQVRQNAEGRVVYIAMPSGQKEATFVASKLEDGLAVFDNPGHDFPQRITYRSMAGDRLVAQIEGTRGDAVRAIDFPMKRVSCDSLLTGRPVGG